jgi:nucleoside triphosphate diphosphatase
VVQPKTMHINQEARHPQPEIYPLVEVMARLRNPDNGCPWDLEQNFQSVAPYTIEEAYEVADACTRDDMDALKDELGDLLLQVVFHSRMAEERGAFALNDVITSICDKMVRRHPHVFGPEGSEPDWEGIKANERSTSSDQSALAGVALSLPALLRAEKIQKRAARTGFDWPNGDGALEKVAEEIAEVQAARSDEERTDEMGDLLFAVVNWSRHLKVDPETALRKANAKFERRFRTMETIAGAAFAALDLDAKEDLWAQAKARD